MTDTIRTITAKLQFNENCHYKQSNWESNIDIPKQATTIDIISVTNINAPNRINTYYQNNNKNYFNDKLKITAQVKNAHNNELITYGKVNIYFKEDDKELQNLTPQSIDVSNDGLVQIIHQPHGDGYYYAEYISDEDNEYYLPSESTHYNVIFETIPVIMAFNIDKPFVHPEEAVKLSTTLTDVYGNNIDYGTVTFYTERTNDIDNPNDGYEQVLGDPIVVEDGKAEIEYSPIQLYNNQLNFYYNDETGNLIYSYEENQDFRVIYITDDNQYLYPDTEIGDIIYIPNDENNEIVYNNNIIYFRHDDIYHDIKDNIEYIYAHYNYENDNYAQNFKYYSPHRCKAPLAILNPDKININVGVNNKGQFKNIYDTYDKNDGFLHVSYDEPLILQATITDMYNNIINDFDENDTITFHIYSSATKDAHIYDYDITDTHMEIVGRYNGNVFEAVMDTPLTSGYHTIYGHFPGNKYLVDGDTITLYICVEHAQSEVNITLDGLPSQLNNTNLNKNTQIGIINKSENYPINDTQWKNLFNKTNICYLLLNDIQYECIIQYNQSSNNFKILLKDNIIFQHPNNFYAKILLAGGVYNNIALPTSMSQEVLLKVRKALKPKITSLSIEKDIYPGKIKGVLNVDNIYDEQPTVTVTINNNGNKQSQNYIYNGEEIIFTFNNIDASINEHTIQASIGNQKSEEQYFRIKRANLTTYLDMDYRLAQCSSKNKSTLITGINKIISMIVESDGQDFTNYNTNNISINLACCDCNDYIHPTPQVTKINNNQQLRVTYQQTLSLPTDWKTGIVFSGDDNFSAPDVKYYSFRTKTIKPYVKYIRNDDEKQLNIFVSDEKNNSINQYILVEVEIQDMSGYSHYSNIITDTNGTAILDCNTEAFESDTQWQNIQKIIFTVNPFNRDKIEIIQNSNDKINVFKSQYPNLQCGDTCAPNNVYITGLLNQLSANNYECFYTTYSDIISIQKFQTETSDDVYVAPVNQEDEVYQSNNDETG